MNSHLFLSIYSDLKAVRDVLFLFVFLQTLPTARQGSPGWICDLTGTGQWLHTDSRRSTRATGPTETPGRSETSADEAEMKISSSSSPKAAKCLTNTFPQVK